MQITRKEEKVCELVRASSSDASVHFLRLVSVRLRRYKRWLNKEHPYNDVINALRSADSVDEVKLGEYIACSAPLHLADGWNYLSRAFDAASHGDRDVAYHLAYYAELRAAMSLLATEGMGIFLYCHVAFDGSFQATWIKENTHKAVWNLLSAWSQQGRAEKLLKAISLDSKSLSDWLEAVGVYETERRLVAKEWLKAWSIDLKVLSDDQIQRNEISYRPTRIRTPAPPPVDPHQEMIEPLFNSWTALEPWKDKGSIALDTSLLREAIMLVTKERRCHYTSFEDAVHSLEDDMSKPLYCALNQENPSNAAIFREAKLCGAPGKATTPILARGLLMLRLASASTASLLAAAEISKSDLEFWWSALGTDLGLWETPADVEAFSDLWTDVAEAKEEADALISAIQGGGSVRSVATILARDISLTQFSRAPMWLLGLD